jgi:para-nitrobenzyl esterase
VPVIIGSNSDEGQYTTVRAGGFREDSRKRFGDRLDDLLKLYPDGTDAEAAQSKHDERRDESFAGERAEARSEAGLGVPVFLYYFDRKPPGRHSEVHGAFHAAELEYAFNTQSATDRPWEERDRRLASVMIRYWVNFAAKGNPNGPGLPEWPAYDPKTDMEMELGDQVAARPVPDKARLEFLEPVLNREAR